MIESSTLDKKSLRVLALAPKDWSIREIAKDCVAFANARGGQIYFGIEDKDDMPAASQQVHEHLCEVLAKAIYHHTIIMSGTRRSARYHLAPPLTVSQPSPPNNLINTS